MLSIHDLHDFTVVYFTRVTITRLVTSRRSLEITYNNSFDNTIIRSNEIIFRLHDMTSFARYNNSFE